MKIAPFFRLGLFCLLALVCFSVKVSGQTIDGKPLYCTDEDRAIFDRLLTEMKNKRALPQEALAIEVARFFLGTPYVGATLEMEPEGLVINLRELDCTTFVENVIALTRMLKSSDPSFNTYCHKLQELRYRNSVTGNYTDRLHYTTDWLYENERKGIMKDVTREIGGIPYALNLSFMSTHPDSYRQLKGHPELIQQMADKEKEINARSYYYIPEADIDRLGEKMCNGDMVCFVTTIGGLDISHVGIIYHAADKLTFFHASTSAKKVILNEDPLAVYVQKIKSNTGVMIARMQ